MAFEWSGLISTPCAGQFSNTVEFKWYRSLPGVSISKTTNKLRPEAFRTSTTAKSQCPLDAVARSTRSYKAEKRFLVNLLFNEDNPDKLRYLLRPWNTYLSNYRGEWQVRREKMYVSQHVLMYLTSRDPVIGEERLSVFRWIWTFWAKSLCA